VPFCIIIHLEFGEFMSPADIVTHPAVKCITMYGRVSILFNTGNVRLFLTTPIGNWQVSLLHCEYLLLSY